MSKGLHSNSQFSDIHSLIRNKKCSIVNQTYLGNKPDCDTPDKNSGIHLRALKNKSIYEPNPNYIFIQENQAAKSSENRLTFLSFSIIDNLRNKLRIQYPLAVEWLCFFRSFFTSSIFIIILFFFIVYHVYL